MTLEKTLATGGAAVIVASVVSLVMSLVWGFAHRITQGQWPTYIAKHIGKAVFFLTCGITLFLQMVYLADIKCTPIMARGIFWGVILPPAYLFAHILASTVRWARGQ